MDTKLYTKQYHENNCSCTSALGRVAHTFKIQPLQSVLIFATVSSSPE
jgi:hypothetical protein